MQHLPNYELTLIAELGQFISKLQLMRGFLENAFYFQLQGL